MFQAVAFELCSSALSQKFLPLIPAPFDASLRYFISQLATASLILRASASIKMISELFNTTFGTEH